MSDSDSSDCSSSSDSTFETPAYSAPAKGSEKTVDTYTYDGSDDSSSDGSFASDSDNEDSDSSDDEAPKAKTKPEKPAPASTSKEPEGGVPEGISEEAFKAFFSKPLDDEVSPKPQRRAPERTPSIGLDASEHLVKQTEIEMEKRRRELSVSTHSLESCEEMLENLSAEFDFDEPKQVEDFDIAKAAEAYKKEPKEKKAPTVSQTTLLKNKREMRLSKVRERLRAKEEAKEREEDQKMEQKMKDAMCPTGNLDMSEAARRDRAYSWYTRMAMPTREAMKEKVDTMPTSSGLTKECVDLLPWNASGKMVNVAKMQKFINAGFKKKFTSRRKTKAAVDSDSDSD